MTGARHRKGTWDQLWRGRRRQYIYRNILDAFGQCVGDPQDARVLEVGCGRGVTLLELARRDANVVGLDYSAESMTVCQQFEREVKPSGSTSFVQGDAFHLPFAAASFDFVYSVGLIEHFENPLQLLLEQYRVLRPGGTLLVQVPQRYSPYTIAKNVLMRLGKWPYGGWETQFSRRELTQLAEKSGFKPRLCYGYGSFMLAATRHLVAPTLDFGGMWKLGAKWPWLRVFKANTSLDLCLIAQKSDGRAVPSLVEVSLVTDLA